MDIKIGKFEFGFNRKSVVSSAPLGTWGAETRQGITAWALMESEIHKNGESDSTSMMRQVLSKQVIVAKGTTVGIPDIGFKGARQQLFQRFNLVDLYAVAHNNSALKTATLSLKQEVFRRGMTWEPAFNYRCESCGTDYSREEAEEAKFDCPECYKGGKERVQSNPEGAKHKLRAPDPKQRTRFEQIIQKCNIYNQSLMRLLQSLEDDLNIADDGFLYLSSEYSLDWQGNQETITREVKQLFRLDPVFVEFDTDDENRPGFAHHICLAHRENLLTIPKAEGWEHEWKGRCPIDGHTTFPVIYRYTPYRGVFGSHPGGPGPERTALYLVQGEVAHISKFSPSELYGYSPVLAIYEKVLSLIGMDRYLYDYFFERQVPQGVITTVTDNPEDLEVRKEQMLADVLANPHHIPWLAVSSRTGQGKTEFVRFAYSLDELQFIPVEQYLERSIAGVYGVPGLFMGFEQSGGGLNNESQQLTRMSRGAQLSQDVYNTELFPVLLKAFGITDWELMLQSAEERTEQLEWEIKQRKAAWAQIHVSMGMGVKYNQDEDSYEITGEVKSAEDQQKEMQGQFGGGGQPGQEQGQPQPEALGFGQGDSVKPKTPGMDETAPPTPNKEQPQPKQTSGQARV